MSLTLLATPHTDVLSLLMSAPSQSVPSRLRLSTTTAAQNTLDTLQAAHERAVNQMRTRREDDEDVRRSDVRRNDARSKLSEIKSCNLESRTQTLRLPADPWSHLSPDHPAHPPTAAPQSSSPAKQTSLPRPSAE